MIAFKQGKRIHRISISVDDETLILLTHLASFAGKELSSYVGQLVEEGIHGKKIRLPEACAGEQGFHSFSGSQS
jgi:hypothetical protein